MKKYCNFFVALYALVVILSSGSMQALDATPVVAEPVDLEKEIATLSSLLSERTKALGLDCPNLVSRLGNAGKVAAFSTLMAMGVSFLTRNTQAYYDSGDMIPRFYDNPAQKLGIKNANGKATLAAMIDGALLGAIFTASVTLSSQIGSLPTLDLKRVILTMAVVVSSSCFFTALYEQLGGGTGYSDLQGLVASKPFCVTVLFAVLLSAWVIKQRFDLRGKQQEIAQLVRDIAACKTLKDCKMLREKIIALG